MVIGFGLLVAGIGLMFGVGPACLVSGALLMVAGGRSLQAGTR